MGIIGDLKNNRQFEKNKGCLLDIKNSIIGIISSIIYKPLLESWFILLSFELKSTKHLL